LSLVRRAALGDTTVIRDGIVRLRPPPGLHFMRGATTLDAAEIAGILGEVVVMERALLDGTVLDGPVRAALPSWRTSDRTRISIHPRAGSSFMFQAGILRRCACFLGSCMRCPSFILEISIPRAFGSFGICGRSIPG
jgi:hypothetical protein